MRRFFPLLAGLVFIGMACACPVSGDVQGTLEAMQGTIGAALTVGPGLLTEFASTPGIEVETPDLSLPGFIRGHLSYPSEYLPAQRIIAYRVISMEVEADVTTEEGQGEYELSVAAGDYFVVAYTTDGGLAAGYSQAVPCGLLNTCTDHSLIPVHVEAGEVVEDIDPQDWYAPAGTFPAMP